MTKSADASPVVVSFPWLQIEDEKCVSEFGRHSLVVPGHVDEVVASVCEDALPLIGRWADSTGGRWSRFELPASDWESGPMQRRQTDLSLESGSRRSRAIKVALAAPLPRPSVDFQSQSDGEEAESLLSLLDERTLHFSRVCEQVTDGHVEFINDLCDRQRPHRHFWEENVDGTCLRSVHRVLCSWHRSGARDDARLSLIVKLASKLPIVLENVCRQPRVVLRRVRQMLSVGRVQEIDASCLRWLARQPGITIAEKAGTRQQVLGITRIEDADTAENRVVRDLLIRAAIECRRYLSDFQRFPNHHRVVQVRRFLTQLRDHRVESPVGRASPLVGPPQPNYVLQHEPRYAVLWEAYQLLVRQQKQQENVWRWRERTWSEVCGLSIWSAIKRLNAKGTALRSDVLLRDEHFSGRFLLPTTSPTRWDFSHHRPGTHIDVVDGPTLSRHPGVPTFLKSLCPDFVLVPVNDGNALRPCGTVIPIWTLLGSPVPSRGFHFALSELNRCLKEGQCHHGMHGLIVTPAFFDSTDWHPFVDIVSMQTPDIAQTSLVKALAQIWGLKR